MAALFVVPAVACAATITGTVVNKTVNKPSAGDDVVLIRFAQGMQEATRTKTDSRGHYSLDVTDDGLHLVRVTHDKANYFKPAQLGVSTVDVDVYNAAARVKGVSAEADVMRLQTDESGKTLRVVENFFVKNDSAPPMTQFGERAFEFYLPAGAVVEGSAALAPGGMPVQAAPVPLGDANHYSFIFPIRPGETRFQITYHVAYSGSLALAPRPMLPTDTVAVMMPKSMEFKADAASPYTSISDEVNAQTFVARNVQPSQALGFTLSGTGQLPRDTQAPTADGAQGAGGGDTGGQADAGAAPGAAADRTKFGGGLGNPVDPGATNDPWSKYRWWILGGLGLALAAGAGVLLRKQPGGGAREADAEPGYRAAPASAGSLLAVLKDELFRLESERLRGRVTDAEYLEEKSALEVVLRRALVREEHSAGVSSGPVMKQPVESA